MITKPICEELFNKELGDPVHKEDDASWRHGSYRTEVYHRVLDNTYWQASYRVSTDGETHELREGIAEIVQVWPYEKTVTEYRTPNE
jgi:hypothetical protein